MELLFKQRRLWAEIDLNAAEYNFRQIPYPVCCVVKANAYGHGAVRLASFYEKLGAVFFAVSNIEEAIQLRINGITKPILILGYSPAQCASELQRYNISQAVYSLEYAEMLSKECEKQNANVKVHIKIDTGMGRIGFQYHKGINELDEAVKACRLQGMILEGIFTHFAVADEGVNNYTKEQAHYFDDAINYIENSCGIRFSFHHCSNSAAAFDYPEYHMDMVRAGIALYGINPTPNVTVSLKHVLSLKAVVSNVKKIRKGDSVSYGRTFIAKRNMSVATIPIGYADGFWRSNSGSYVFINKSKCKIIGRVCMDQILVECKKVQIGDEVEIYSENISVEEVARHNHTIPYEILCAIGERVPRVYKYNGEIVCVKDNILDVEEKNVYQER